MNVTEERPAPALDLVGSWSTEADILEVAVGAQAGRNRAELMLLQACGAWAITHPVLPGDDWSGDPCLAGEGCPDMDRRVVPELACRLHLSTETASGWVGEALELRYRLPRLWALTLAERLPVWQARLIARSTMTLSREAARFVDQAVAAVGGKVGPGQLRRTIAHAKTVFMPEQAEREAREAADRRDVQVDFDRDGEFHALAQVSGWVDHADGLDLERALQSGAAALKASGCTAPLGARRSMAMGDIARGQAMLTPDTQPEDDQPDDRPCGAQPGDRSGGDSVGGEGACGVSGGWGTSDGFGPSDGQADDDDLGARGRDVSGTFGVPDEQINGDQADDERFDDDQADDDQTSGDLPDDEQAGADRRDDHRVRVEGSASDPKPGASESGVSRPVPRLTRELVVHVMIDGVSGAGIVTPGRVPITAEHLRSWCGAPATTMITIRPVIDLNEPCETSAYRIPDRVREHVALRDRRCCFPYCDRPAHPVPIRWTVDDQPVFGVDIDHIIPFDQGGPTSTGNTAPLCRHHHRIKTITRWRYFMLRPGVFCWVDPSGHTYIRTRHGTVDLPITPVGASPDGASPDDASPDGASPGGASPSDAAPSSASPGSGGPGGSPPGETG